MKPHAIDNSSPSSEALASDGVLQDLRLLWREWHGLIHAQVQLAALETRRVGESLVMMVVVGLMVGVLLIGAWLGLVVAVVMRLIEHGMMASDAILLAVAANLLVVLVLCRVLRRSSRYLQYPTLVRSLEPMPPPSKESA